MLLHTKVIYFSCANILLRTASISQIRFRNVTISGLFIIIFIEPEYHSVFIYGV